MTINEEVITSPPPVANAKSSAYQSLATPTLSSIWQSMPLVPEIEDLPVYLKKDELRKQLQRAASKLAGLMGVRPWVLHKQWIEVGGQPQEEATEDDLWRKLTYFLQCIAEINRKRQEKRLKR